MKNRDVYQKDPAAQKLVNEGVASVSFEKTKEALAVLRYELETFVCSGQYEKGMSHILETYLKNIEQAQQPAVWVSGFYGSGKSHLVKMLHALWADTAFEDGATARGIADLPQNIRDSLKELSIRAKRYGGLHAASGTLGAGAGKSVRLALLRIIFKSAGLPELYHVARFVMWLKKEDIYDQVRACVEKDGLDWNEELDNLQVAEGLHKALVQTKPDIFPSAASCVQTLNNLYSYDRDVTSDEMLKAIRQALTKDGKFPLTLVVLDEVQQYIGEDSQRSLEVQEAVESCCRNFGGKLLFIGTGQTAVTGTSNLKKLEGRFTIRVELSDADVDAVIRQVILAKKPEAKKPLEELLEKNQGEISRHLAGTTISHEQGDIARFSQDYPILPVRRRFWERTHRVLDRTGTDSQLRNQLSMVHKAIQINLDDPLGHVVPADFLFFDSADKLLQSRILPRKIHEKTMTWSKGLEEEKLMARACGLIFLINKLSGQNNEIGIRATADTVADLLVEDISQGSSRLRGTLPGMLDRCELLMKVGDEYRIQTEESAAWNDEFQSQCSFLFNESHRLEAERNERLRKKFGEITKTLSLTQGESRVTRETFPIFDSFLPSDADRRIYIWIRDGWTTDENSFLADARQAGNRSPVVYVYIPKRSADDIRRHLIDYKAACATLDKRGIPNSPEGTEARAAMETIRQSADSRINALLEEALSGARVFQGGGNEILGKGLKEMVLEASSNALLRLYPQFGTADHQGWPKVYEKAKAGAPDALKSVGYEGDPGRNTVCGAILGILGGDKKGTEIRTTFESAPFGWPGDAVDGGLQVLLVAGMVRALDDKGQQVDPKELERKTIGKMHFKVESTTVRTAQRIEIRKLMQKAGISAKPDEESASVQDFLMKITELAENAGGEAPKPVRSDIGYIKEIRRTAGNEQLLALYNMREDIGVNIEKWKALAEQINKRIPKWEALKRLAQHASLLADAAVITSQVQTIEQQRQLLEEPDPITPVATGITQLLRDELNKLDKKYSLQYEKGLEGLEKDQNWRQLDPEQQDQLLSECSLGGENRPNVKVQSTGDVLATLDSCPLSTFTDRVAAMSGRFSEVHKRAAEMCEPKAQFVQLPRRTLKNGEEIDAWVAEVREELETALQNGPVVIQ